ncbi:hypothetical protein [Hyphococcus sp.]|jgi:hypothetical protein|uniref:hypothetical protein n=1 Tax=Hyphococcus sp. TaxID=2038636 RepID=UPI003D0D91AC
MTHAKGIFRIRALAAAGALLCAASPVFAAQSLREMRAQESDEAALEREAAFTEQLCGMSFDVTIDWRSFAGWPQDADIARACDRGLSEIEKSCRAGNAPRITRFVCTGDGSGANHSGGTFSYGASHN